MRQEKFWRPSPRRWPARCVLAVEVPGKPDLFMAASLPKFLIFCKKLPALIALAVGCGDPGIGKTCEAKRGVMAGLVPAIHVVRRNE